MNHTGAQFLEPVTLSSDGIRVLSTSRRQLVKGYITLDYRLDLVNV
jgi:hypothetical protein